jgi:phosphoribosylglycinamide formyltransferase-1
MNIHLVALFASGSGSNAVNLIRYFNEHDSIRVGLLVCNKPDAPVVEKVKALGIEVLITDNAAFESGDFIAQALNERQIDWIVLAGFLRKLPAPLVRAYENRIINIHPALLPKYGGKGMYGMFVHQAVIAAKEAQSGITIHLVNEEFDKGEVLAQYSVDLDEQDSPESVAMKVQQLEHLYFPSIVERTINSI